MVVSIARLCRGGSRSQGGIQCLYKQFAIGHSGVAELGLSISEDRSFRLRHPVGFFKFPFQVSSSEVSLPQIRTF